MLGEWDCENIINKTSNQRTDEYGQLPPLTTSMENEIDQRLHFKGDTMIMTAEEIARATDNKDGLANIRAINRLYRKQDESHLAPINGWINVTERAIRRVRRQGYTLYGLEYCYALEGEISQIVNGSI